MEQQPEPQGFEAPAPQPALTIIVQSWMTIVVGALMLAFGLMAGYFGRPLITPAPTSLPSPTQPAAAAATPTSDTTDALQAQRMAFMNAIIAKTRHFRGNPEASVTLIEFSDFQ